MSVRGPLDGASTAGSVLGHPVRRREDPRLVRGMGRYADNIQAEGAAFAVFVRSTVAHARVLSVDSTEAAAMPGVVGVFTDASLGLPPRKGQAGMPDHFDRPLLARAVVRFVGEPVGVVVAESREQAVDAARSVLVDYEPLPAVVDPVAAAAGDGSGTLLFPEAGTNVCYRVEAGQHDEDVLAGADVVVRARFVNQRLAPVPMEPNAVLAAPDPETGGLVVWASCQGPFAVQGAIASALGIEPSTVRVIASDVGGGFGPKMMPYPEQLVVAALARRLERPVRWVETRSENLMTMAQEFAVDLLEVDPADLEVGDGGLRVRGVPRPAVTWAELAERAGDSELAAEVNYKQAGFTFPFGAHVAVVEVDAETGEARLVRHVAVDDCGNVLNPLLAQGQQHGGIAQGAAQALFEEVVFDADGNLRTSSLLDYCMPTANELPRFEADRTVTPTPLNPLGVKGIGESGTIGAGAAVHNAVIDAVSHLGVRHLDMPMTPEKVWNAIRSNPKP